MRWHAVMASTCWRYFPEVNYNHLTSVLKRLELETHMPTGQQATLL